MLGHFEHVDGQLDVHIALDPASTERIGEFLGRLGDHGVAVVIEPIDQRPYRRIFLILDQRRIVERTNQPSFRTKQIEQPLVIYVKRQATRGGIKIGAVNEYGDTFFWIENHLKPHHIPKCPQVLSGRDLASSAAEKHTDTDDSCRNWQQSRRGGL